jgi:hypothetical protein
MNSGIYESKQVSSFYVTELSRIQNNVYPWSHASTKTRKEGQHDSLVLCTRIPETRSDVSNGSHQEELACVSHVASNFLRQHSRTKAIIPDAACRIDLTLLYEVVMLNENQELFTDISKFGCKTTHIYVRHFCDRRS